tara:strand:- start:175 stop:609 length:435 start_codon:yes stop_codon:yes gene_type:complete
MATINTDIAQKIDVIARQNDSMNITLNMTTSSGSAYDLSNTYILFSVYTPETEESLIDYKNASSTSGTLFLYFDANNITMYDKIKISTFTVTKNTAININETTGVVTLSDMQLNLPAGNYKYKMIVQSITSTKTWMYGKFKVND